MATLAQVVEGFRQNIGYIRTISAGVSELVMPMGNGEFSHVVKGTLGPGGGWSGALRFPIEDLTNGQWKAEGWESLGDNPWQLVHELYLADETYLRDPANAGVWKQNTLGYT